MDLTPFEFGQYIKTAMRKQAIVEGIGGLAGMATAPKGQSDLAVGRGALRGIGTAAGGLSGGMLGGVGGGALGALLGALIRREGLGPSNHAGGGMALGALAGVGAGAGYGAYKGNKATKALLDKAAPLDEEKDDKKDT